MLISSCLWPGPQVTPQQRKEDPTKTRQAGQRENPALFQKAELELLPPAGSPVSLLGPAPNTGSGTHTRTRTHTHAHAMPLLQESRSLAASARGKGSPRQEKKHENTGMAVCVLPTERWQFRELTSSRCSPEPPLGFRVTMELALRRVWGPEQRRGLAVCSWVPPPGPRGTAGTVHILAWEQPHEGGGPALVMGMQWPRPTVFPVQLKPCWKENGTPREHSRVQAPPCFICRHPLDVMIGPGLGYPFLSPESRHDPKGSVVPFLTLRSNPRFSTLRPKRGTKTYLHHQTLCVPCQRFGVCL